MKKIDKSAVYLSCQKTIRETSYDKSSRVNLVISDMPVIDFDAVKKFYMDEHGIDKGFELSSNDALYLRGKEDVAFIEFKNTHSGGLRDQKKELIGKMYDSTLMFLDLEGKSPQYAQENVDYILVYNSEKEPSKSQLYNQVGKRGGINMAIERVPFLKKFINYCVRNIYVYDVGEFERNFIKKQ